MSSGKRLAKRSIVGTRVVAPSPAAGGGHGLYEPALIQSMRTFEDPAVENRYVVKFEESRRIVEFPESDIVGQGFQSVSSVRLAPGQVVFVTHNQREMQARVIRHDADTSDVLLRINEDDTVLRKIDEVRLLESRKSARLVNSDTDFSKLADVAISEKKKSKAIEVPRSDYVQIAGSRKRRTSENISEEYNMRDYCDSDEEEEVMTECSAALLLMKLSCSPHSPAFYGSSAPPAVSAMHQKQLPSPVESSSGASSFRSSTPSPPLSSSVTDEGIVKDYSEQSSEQQAGVIYQCTYPGCREERFDVASIEAHVRTCHLNREPDKQYDDGEEEFYYTEIEIAPAPPPRVRSYSHSVIFDLSLADHLVKNSSSTKRLFLYNHQDMVRPPHEDPGIPMASAGIVAVPPSRTASKVRSFSGGNRFNTNSLLNSSHQINHHPLTMPITIAPSVGSPGKLILISPPSQHSSVKSPTRRVRDGKKCRKVYGLEQRDLWCTQCKWKKACARFGTQTHATAERNNNFQHQVVTIPQSGQSTSLLMAAQQVRPSSFVPSSSAIKAIKF